ncbi:hypothetical protein [Microbulbifer sp. 2205BS26-8]|nr:hypothetical protein [Microbulbifer sp. 2205BS26-8]MDP5209228.1 hypothetical protein [Microbulbifer sp. 2205BS26-8]
MPYFIAGPDIQVLFFGAVCIPGVRRRCPADGGSALLTRQRTWWLG